MIPGGSELLAHRTANELFVGTVLVTTIVFLAAEAGIAAASSAYGATGLAVAVGPEIVDTAAEMAIESATGLPMPLVVSPTDLLQDSGKGVAKKGLKKAIPTPELAAPKKAAFNRVPEELPPFDPKGTLGAAKAWTIKGRLKAAQLPTTRKRRYAPPQIIRVGNLSLVEQTEATWTSLEMNG